MCDWSWWCLLVFSNFYFYSVSSSKLCCKCLDSHTCFFFPHCNFKQDFMLRDVLIYLHYCLGKLTFLTPSLQSVLLCWVKVTHYFCERLKSLIILLLVYCSVNVCTLEGCKSNLMRQLLFTIGHFSFYRIIMSSANFVNKYILKNSCNL